MRLPSVAAFLKGATRQLDVRWQYELDDGVVALEWSPDGAYLAALSAAGTLTLWAGATGSPGRSCLAHRTGGMTLSWAADGTHLATGGQDRQVCLWDPATGDRLASLPAGAAWVERVAWSPLYPDGAPAMLASAAGKVLRFWTPTGDLISEHRRHTSTIADIHWHPAQRRLVTACYGLLTVWMPGADLPTEVFAWKMSHLAVRWQPQGRYLVAGEQDATLHVWDAVTGEDLLMSGYATKVRELAWQPQGRFLATGGGAAVTLWDFAGDGPAGSTPIVLEGHSRPVTALAYRPDGAQLASGATDGLFLWRPPERPSRRTPAPVGRCDLAGGVACLAWRPDGAEIAVGGAQGKVLVVACDTVS
ncbi:MAG: WD40 repeat domain-containing protein [Acidobacteriota bacterium]